MPTMSDGQVMAWSEAEGQYVPRFVGELPGEGGPDPTDLDSRYVRKDVSSPTQTMLAPLTLPSNGLVVGTTQLVASGGRVGVGRSPATYPLEVQGDVYSTGSYRGDGSLLTSVDAASYKGNAAPTATEFSRLSGVTSAIQTQLNAKEPTIAAGTTAQYWRGDKTFQTLTTAVVAELTNLYYTDTRARAALSSASANQIAYNSSTGVIGTAQDIHTGASPQFTKLGLGIAPSVDLHVQKNTNGAVEVNIYNTSTGNSAYEQMVFGQSSTQNLGLVYLNSGVPSGFGGVATNQPNTGYIAAAAGATGGIVIRCNANAPIRFATGGVAAANERMIITGAGAVGIGTSSPTAGYTLDVAGAVQVQSNLLLSAATANLYLKDTSTGWQAASTLVVTPQTGNSIRSTSYTSGLVGWNVNAAGDAEFNNVDVRGAIRSAVFVYQALQATAGTLGVFKSAAKTLATVTIPASPTYGTTQTTVAVEDQEGITHAASQLFAVNDILRLKDALVGDTWLRVASVTDNTTYWAYNCVIMAGTAGVIYQTGMAVADYGQSGNGFIIQTADQTNAPYLQMATHAAGFTSLNSSGSLVVTPQLRLGNLNGSYGYSSNVYGLGAGQYGAASTTWITVDQTSGFRIGNNTTQVARWATDGSILVGQAASGQSNVLISSGAVQLRNNTTARMQLSSDGSGFLANSSIAWDTSGNLTVTGNAVIAGWTINTASITSGGLTLAASATAASNKIYAGTGTYANANTGFYADGSGRFSLKDKLTWDGTTLTITGGGTFSGALSAATGTFAGSLSAATGTFAGSLTAASGSITGTLAQSSATGALAIGTTPPTSAAAGTGIWLDRTGLYGLASSVVQAKIDAATGAVVAGAGNVTLNASGLTLVAGTGEISQVTWKDSGVRSGLVTSVYEPASDLSSTCLSAYSKSADSAGGAHVLLSALNNQSDGAYFALYSQGSAAGDVGVAYLFTMGQSFRNFSIGTAADSGTNGINIVVIGNGTAPTSSPAGVGQLYCESGAGKWRGSSGTVTTFGPAEPHCPTCGRDFVLEWQNERYGHLLICMYCFTEGKAKGVIMRPANP